jgi:hypothetical protein
MKSLNYDSGTRSNKSWTQYILLKINDIRKQNINLTAFEIIGLPYTDSETGTVKPTALMRWVFMVKSPTAISTSPFTSKAIMPVHVLFFVRVPYASAWSLFSFVL